MSAILLNVKDFSLFADVLKSAAKLLNSAKFTVTANGLEIYGARERMARCEITSDAISSAEPVCFSVENLQMFLKVVTSVRDAHDGDFSGLKFKVDLPFIRFESKKIKTKFSTCNENTIQAWISKKIEVEMTPVFEFTSTSDFIKRVNGHSFMFSDPKSVRVYLETKDDMENNTVYATIGNRETDLNNEITLKFALVNSGSLVEKDGNGLVVNERRIIIDLERLNLFNAVQANAIKFQFMNMNCLVCKTSVQGRDGAFFNMAIYCTILKD